MRLPLGLLVCCGVGLLSPQARALTAEEKASLPAPANRTIDFGKEVKPIFEASCIKCHGRGKDKGGFKLDTRETMLKGGDSGPAVVPGKSEDSLLIALVHGVDPDNVMPKKGSRLTAEQVGLLRAWIDQGAKWDSKITFGRLEPANLKPHRPELAVPQGTNALDLLLARYEAAHQLPPARVVDDRTFARRVYLDINGLLPPPSELRGFEENHAGDKREKLVRQLLERDDDYAQQWMSFWNDLLRNDYKGTGYIDGGRKQITRWLYSALLTNMPYDRFVAQLINPIPESEGFVKGIVWRGVVNASQTPQMQAAQHISQVFMGVNLKCASCHDSFINDLTLADAYGLAGIYADEPLEMVHCDKPTGQKAALKFIYPELGAIDPKADKPERLKELAQLICGRQDGRLTRTFVNRLWQRFLGRGLVEPLEDMEKPAWSPDMLDWLAEDFADHQYNIKHLIFQITTSRAYQTPSVNLGEQTSDDYVFRGPAVRRLSAEQFRDAITTLTGVGYSTSPADIPMGRADNKKFAPAVAVSWIWNDPKAADKARAGRVYFRKTIALEKVPQEALCFVSCDNAFDLYVNGKKVGSGNDFKTLSQFDLRARLHPGTNVIAIDAVNNLPDNAPPPEGRIVQSGDNPAGLLFYARLRSPALGKTKAATNDFASDQTWLCSDQKAEGWQGVSFSGHDWKPASKLGDMSMAPWRVAKEHLRATIAANYPGKLRAVLVPADPLMTAMNRPNREQVVTTRASVATTLQGLELTNGETLAEVLRRGAQEMASDHRKPAKSLIQSLYLKALSRAPSRQEMSLAREIVGQPVEAAGVEDLIWVLAMLPEFQLIY